MMRMIDSMNFEFFPRQRLLFEMTCDTGAKLRQFSLNEIFVAEENIGKTSVFHFSADGKYVGKFKSSGMLISTGTGSTGWLYAAKRMTEKDVKRVLSELGFSDEPEAAIRHISQ